MTPTPPNMEKKMELIRQKCIEANPDIVELKFGCEMVTAASFGRGDISETSVIVDVKEFFKERSIQDTNGVWSAQSDNRKKSKGEAWVYDGIFCRKISLEDLEHVYEVIGRSITLADVLRSIETKCKDEGVYGFSRQRFVDYMDDISTVWNLRYNKLNEQSDETINFIYDLLQ